MSELVDRLANEIRRVDGSNTLGAGLLAEALMPFIESLQPACAEWRDIESAPKDGTVVQVHNTKWLEPCPAAFTSEAYLLESYGDEDYMEEGWYPSYGFLFDLPEVTIDPTHWQPLPAPPLSAAKDKTT